MIGRYLGHEFSDDDVRVAMGRFDREVRETFPARKWKWYAVEEAGRSYPPKELMRLVIGEEDVRSGGLGLNRVFDRLGFRVIDLRTSGPALGGAGADDGVDDDEAAAGQRFPYEDQLQAYLVHNLSTIEPGLTLYEDASGDGVEYPAGHRRIDILAVDRDGHPVVIELKLAGARDRALGQLSFYMSWVDEHLGMGPSRGVIVAYEISEELVMAVRRVPGVALYRYRMSFAVEAVASSTSA